MDATARFFVFAKTQSVHLEQPPPPPTSNNPSTAIVPLQLIGKAILIFKRTEAIKWHKILSVQLIVCRHAKISLTLSLSESRVYLFPRALAKLVSTVFICARSVYLLIRQKVKGRVTTVGHSQHSALLLV